MDIYVLNSDVILVDSAVNYIPFNREMSYFGLNRRYL